MDPPTDLPGQLLEFSSDYPLASASGSSRLSSLRAALLSSTAQSSFAGASTARPTSPLPSVGQSSMPAITHTLSSTIIRPMAGVALGAADEAEREEGEISDDEILPAEPSQTVSSPADMGLLPARRDNTGPSPDRASIKGRRASPPRWTDATGQRHIDSRFAQRASQSLAAGRTNHLPAHQTAAQDSRPLLPARRSSSISAAPAGQPLLAHCRQKLI